MRTSPPFNDTTGFEFRPVRGDLNAASNRDLFDTDISNPRGDTPVLTGSSFVHWNPDFGRPYAYADNAAEKHILEKTLRSARSARSAFHGLGYARPEELPMHRARIAFRDVCRANDSRTMICCLLPPGIVLVHKAPYLVRRAGDERDESYLLGVLSSIPFDWYSRRFVELAMTFEILNPMPIPRPPENDPRRARVVEIAGRLAARDDRFVGWAKAVGVPVASVKAPAERADLEAELDALVAHLYGLSGAQVEQVFRTFHRGWAYQPRLATVLAHFQEIGEPT